MMASASGAAAIQGYEYGLQHPSAFWPVMIFLGIFIAILILINIAS